MRVRSQKRYLSCSPICNIPIAKCKSYILLAQSRASSSFLSSFISLLFHPLSTRHSPPALPPTFLALPTLGRLIVPIPDVIPINRVPILLLPLLPVLLLLLACLHRLALWQQKSILIHRLGKSKSFERLHSPLHFRRLLLLVRLLGVLRCRFLLTGGRAASGAGGGEGARRG